MDIMYIIKSGELRFRRGGGSGSAGPGFSGKISLKTAYKAGKLATTQQLIAEQTQKYAQEVLELEKTKPNKYPGDYQTAEVIKQSLSECRQQLTLWKAARAVPVQLVEV